MSNDSMQPDHHGICAICRCCGIYDWNDGRGPACAGLRQNVGHHDDAPTDMLGDLEWCPCGGGHLRPAHRGPLLLPKGVDR